MHTLTVYYRPDSYPDWVLWRTLGPFDMIGDASKLGAGGVPSAKAGFAPRQSLGKPQDDTDRLETGRNLRRGYYFQVRIVGSGHVILDRLRLHGKQQVEDSKAKVT